jgi:hypothetical protein
MPTQVSDIHTYIHMLDLRSSAETVVMLIGNKCDLPERAVPTETAREFAGLKIPFVAGVAVAAVVVSICSLCPAEHGMSFLETSVWVLSSATLSAHLPQARDSINVTEAFEHVATGVLMDVCSLCLTRTEILHRIQKKALGGREDKTLRGPVVSLGREPPREEQDEKKSESQCC